ncbi:hypothetical protein CFE70_004141 [Pyrenophora teres f. teres 0-1]|uniref:N-acetyltransferase domain-containing protein n=2 Tax=Pyrenophora teres f. teres TaxID=97479 RepID=E3RDS7_PYRTT|nr:hypothetical protein PTT_02835 [Pyrenophora teres f. teres 0-1]KAE8833091.1 hypothetical protein HRS9139_04910 [Pyrenophora teres f. teres]KAE8841140.1 hypothetical protein PTNB85_04539 [Pyrenophora teres f. teres]KAE8848722.1 hypothetical protein HRS9122_02738 [Pyrenophora teres f. teres]KAE8864636.1 hypothetical protein PTNB29_04600 [Pyrenophora teres f. teres]
MSRGVTRIFCPRITLPPSPAIEETEPAPKENSIDDPTGSENEAMTWQQKTDFSQPKGKRKPGRVQWTPFDLEAEAAAQTIAAQADNSWAAQRAEFSSTVEQPRQKARGKAATPTFTHSTTPLTSAKSLLSETPNSSNAHKTSKQTRKRSRNKSKSKDNNMSTHPKGKEYIPPHLRKHNSASGKEYVPPHLRNRNSGNGTPAMSPKSKLSTTTKLHSSPIGAHQHQDAPPSPPTTPQEPEQHREVVYDAWDFSKPSPPPAVKKNLGNPRWPRGPQPYKKTVWPKARDMKYVPHSSDDDGGVETKSNSNGDPDYDIKKLLDWNGDWLPAPESWSARKGHEDRHFGQHIEQWMNNHSPECIKPIYFPQPTFNGHAKTTRISDKNHTEYVLDEGQVCKELAPHYWLEARVGDETLRDAWKRICASDLEPIDEGDLAEHLPWWERYEDIVYTEDGQENPSPFINPLEVPEARIDFADSSHPVEEWQLASAEAKLQARKRRMDDKQRKMLARRNRPAPATAQLAPPMEDRRLRPKTNMYIRPVQPADVRGITEIYNWYVENSIHAIEFDGRTEAQMGQRISDITSAGLPYLVAIDRGNRSRLTNEYVNEKIVGFIKLEDYCGQSTLFRYTFDMELFVHPGFLNKGIGKCLMDRILEMADTSYYARGGYEYINNFEYLKAGPSRVIKTILINVHHENGGDSMENGWQSKFLSTFKFNRSGRLPKVGYKNDKVVDVSIYAHHTREDINASGRPTVAG